MSIHEYRPSWSSEMLIRDQIPCHLHATPMFGTNCFLNGKATETKHLYWQVASSAAHGQYQWADDATQSRLWSVYAMNHVRRLPAGVVFLRTYLNRKKRKKVDMHMNLISKHVKLRFKDHWKVNSFRLKDINYFFTASILILGYFRKPNS